MILQFSRKEISYVTQDMINSLFTNMINMFINPAKTQVCIQKGNTILSTMVGSADVMVNKCGIMMNVKFLAKNVCY